MRAFWLAWALLGVGMDVWCYKTGRMTLTRTIVTTLPWFVGIPLVVIGTWHLIDTWWDRWRK